MKLLLIISILIGSVFLYIYFFSISTISGYVYDYDTGLPIEDAIVKYCFNSKTGCNENSDDASITDKRGFYSVKIEKPSKSELDKFIVISKKGYVNFLDNLNKHNNYELSVYMVRK